MAARVLCKVFVVVVLLVELCWGYQRDIQQGHDWAYREAYSLGMTVEGATFFSRAHKTGAASSPYEFADLHRWVIDPDRSDSRLFCLEASGVWDRGFWEEYARRNAPVPPEGYGLPAR